MTVNQLNTGILDKDNCYIAIMAGGRGERFWPVSRQTTPKQLAILLGNRSLLQQAVGRVLPLFPADRILVITNKLQIKSVRQQLPELPTENIIAEPCGRDTCTAVTLAGAIVASRNPNAVMAVLSADHLIPTIEVFQHTLIEALTLAQENKNMLITLGIQPTEPTSAYGYIQLGKKLDQGNSAYEALRFVEKPDIETAKQYLNSGDYRWNAGMFIWSCEALYRGLNEHQPQMAELFSHWVTLSKDSPQTLMSAIEMEYPTITKISIDCALMEKAENIAVIDSNFVWDDLGSWPALTRYLKQDQDNNCSNNNIIVVDSHDNLIFDYRKKSSRSLTTLLGINHSVIVFTDDATMIADKSQSQRIKELVAKIEAQANFKHLL